MSRLSFLAAGAIALAAASPFAVAQTSPYGSAASPSTPPTYPAERAAPGSIDMAPAHRGTADAIQSCRELSSMQDRDECMRRIGTDRSSTGLYGNPSGSIDSGDAYGMNAPYGSMDRGAMQGGSR